MKLDKKYMLYRIVLLEDSLQKLNEEFNKLKTDDKYLLEYVLKQREFAPPKEKMRSFIRGYFPLLLKEVTNNQVKI